MESNKNKKLSKKNIPQSKKKLKEIKKDVKVMLAHKYDFEKHKDIVQGWLLSEKLDGMRGIYVAADKKMYSRLGTELQIPKEFFVDFPDIDLDGELFCGRGKFDSTGIFRKLQENTSIEEYDKEKLIYIVFDSPSIDDIYINRIKLLKEMIPDSKYIKVIDTWVCKSSDDIPQELENMIKIGAEGLIIRNPKSLYENKRSSNLLKIKSHITDEATVIGYEKGKKGSKYENMVGNLIVKWKNPNDKNVIFNIGSGLTDLQRSTDVPKINSQITFKYFELTKNGLPRMPIFITVRDYE